MRTTTFSPAVPRSACRWVPAVMAVAAVLIVGPAGAKPAKPAKPTAATKPAAAPALETLVPAALPGAASATAVRKFDADNLYEEIDGQATALVEYGVTAMATRTYQVRPAVGGAALPVALRVYDVGTRLQAFGALSQIRPPGSKPAAVGALGASSRGEVLFCQERYLVNLLLVGAPASETAPAMLVPLAKAVAAKLPGTPALPAELALLPKSGRQAQSERYTLANALGLDYLNHALSAGYTLKGHEEPVQLTIALLKDAAEAKDAFDKLSGEMQQAAAVEPTLGEGAIQGANPFLGRTIIVRKGRYLLLLPKVLEQGPALGLLQEALAALKGK